jgi:hypothetical protein
MWVEPKDIFYYTATHCTTLNNNMISYEYSEVYDVWFELEYTDITLAVIPGRYGPPDYELALGYSAIYTGNFGLAGWRHDPSEPLEWDDYTGYMDYIHDGYSEGLDGVGLHVQTFIRPQCLSQGLFPY